VKRLLAKLTVSTLLLTGVGGALVVAQAAPAFACTFNAALYTVWANDPVVFKGQVMDQGGVNQYPSPMCGSPQASYWYTKACGFFGCSWETWANTQARQPDSNSYYQWAIYACRHGLNRYYSSSHFYNVGGPGYEVDANSSGQPEFAC
jgi:hypothetical protein